MGLDMYLHAERYVSGYEFYGAEQVAKYNAVLAASGMAHLADADTPSLYVKVTAAYWRKANAIHAWFVDKVQGGVDECQVAYVSREQLTELRAACVTVLDADSNRAAVAEDVGLLPRGGFFFGNTDLDEWYFESLRYTRDRISLLLDAGDDYSFTYQSSW